MGLMDDLRELCDIIEHEIGEANDKIRSAGGKLTAGDVDYVDKLTHTLKSIKATMAMVENENGYSNRAWPDINGGYRYGGGYRTGYARGNRRDGSNGYSRDDGMIEDLREMMNNAPNESVKRELQRVLEKMEG